MLYSVLCVQEPEEVLEVGRDIAGGKTKHGCTPYSGPHVGKFSFSFLEPFSFSNDSVRKQRHEAKTKKKSPREEKKRGMKRRRDHGHGHGP